MQVAQGDRVVATPGTFEKQCNRCGRRGSHAFRRTPDGLYECTTVSACRARARRKAGARRDGRGRLPKLHGLSDGTPGVAYVIGPRGSVRASIEETLRELTAFSLAVGEPNRRTLTALSSRNVKLIVIDVGCLSAVGFRNEFTLRRSQPRLSVVPVFVYGDRAAIEPFRDHVPEAQPVAYDGEREVARQLRRRIRSFERAGSRGAPPAEVASES